MTFEWISSTAKTSGIDGLIMAYDDKIKGDEQLKARVTNAYLLQHNVPRWFVDKAAKKDWKDTSFSKMLAELEQSKEQLSVNDDDNAGKVVSEIEEPN